MWYYLRSRIFVDLNQLEEALSDARKGLKIAKRSENDDLITLLEEQIKNVENYKSILDDNSTKNIDGEEGKDNTRAGDEDFEVLKRIFSILRECSKDSEGRFSKGNVNKDDKLINEDDEE